MTARALLVALALALGMPATGNAQIFIASRPAPDFQVGPLFVRANVTPALGPIEVDVFWSVAVPPQRSGAELQQDIYLLWPSAVVGDAKIGKPETQLEKYVEARGFDVIDGGRVVYATRNLYGSQSGQWDPIAGGAPFVTYVRSSGAMGLTSPATFIRIPWDPRMLNRAFLMKLTLKTKGLLKDKPGTWIEHTLWGSRYRLTLSFNEVRARGVFPMYFQHRDRVIKLSDDPAQLLMDFTDSPHLKIDELSPGNARRQLSETRQLTDTVSLYIDRGEGLTPQTLNVQFGYFTGLQSWAPVLIPLAFFLAGNLGGVLLRTIAERVSKRWAGRVRFWRDREQPVQRQTGVILDRATLARITPGRTTYEQVLELCGHNVEERVILTDQDRKTLIYRGRRVIPHHRRLAGVLATVTYWDVEDHEVEMAVERNVVQDVQARVRRSRLSGADATVPA